MSLSFGTDGVRGVANVDLTPELVVALGRAIARAVERPEAAAFFLGRDTRVSGPMLSAALSAGITAEGVSVVDAGILPTPGLARLGAHHDAPAAVISASHNQFEDNGIKVFATGGRKLPDEVERRIEDELQRILSSPSAKDVAGHAVGRIASEPDAVKWYAQQLSDTLEMRALEGVRVVLDCANGASAESGPLAFRLAGASVDVIHASPNGININDGCGSTHPSELQKAVIDAQADMGFAFDGDADRVIAVDQDGNLVDGDQLMAMAAVDMNERGVLKDSTVVVTVMSNLGFRLAMAERGISVVETNVGDRYVLEAMLAGGFNFGGEQSGHIIFGDLAGTGDGIQTALHIAALVARSRRKLADLAGGSMTRLPQILRNVRVARREALDDATAVWDAVAQIEAELGDRGRVLIRPSGTEPLIRVMVEAESEAAARDATDRLCATVEHVLG